MNFTARKFKMNILNTKTKSMAMCENYIQIVKTVINGTTIEEVSDFKYLGYLISAYISDIEENLKTQ
jgi:hypothetical protein